MRDVIKAMKSRIVFAAAKAGGGHIPSAFSILDIVWKLYNGPIEPGDVFILSKGHGCLALYAVLEEKGIIPYSALDNFEEVDGILGGHPDRNKVPGVKCSTGSLGHGLPQAVGVALAMKIKGSKNKVYCLVGDGELNEGSCWEALLLASHHQLTNLTVIVDNNLTSPIHLGDLTKKFEAFGCFTYNIDLTDPRVLSLALYHGLRGIATEGPVVVICNTTKGSGVERFKYPEWHHRAPTEEELNEILREINA